MLGWGASTEHVDQVHRMCRVPSPVHISPGRTPARVLLRLPRPCRANDPATSTNSSSSSRRFGGGSRKITTHSTDQPTLADAIPPRPRRLAGGEWWAPGARRRAQLVAATRLERHCIVEDWPLSLTHVPGSVVAGFRQARRMRDVWVGRAACRSHYSPPQGLPRGDLAHGPRGSFLLQSLRRSTQSADASNHQSSISPTGALSPRTVRREANRRH